MEIWIPGNALEVLELQIYDRWGGLLYQANEPRWNGKYNEDRKVNPGVYTWKVKTRSKISGQVYQQVGEITVVW
jgi:gliding motility-associated-like protein